MQSDQVIALNTIGAFSGRIQPTFADLKFNAPPVRILGNDSLDVQNTILSITPEQRKALKINKSTLWYQRRNLGSGKRIKVYGKVLAKLV